MHELGHYLLGHTCIDPEAEWEADYFASCMLAPRQIFINQGIIKADEISTKADISIRAARYAMRDIRKIMYSPNSQ